MLNKFFRNWSGILTFALLSSFGSVAFATVTFDETSGLGLIGRGDVIDHPNLGKKSLVINPLISFGLSGRFIQTCHKMPPGNQTFQRGDAFVGSVVVDTTRQAPGNSNISGYLLNSLGDSTGTTPPSSLCPTGWIAVTSVTFEPGVGSGQLFFDDQSGNVGAWAKDENGLWVPVP